MKRETAADIIMFISWIIVIANTIMINVHLGIYVLAICLTGFSYLIHKSRSKGDKK